MLSDFWLEIVIFCMMLGLGPEEYLDLIARESLSIYMVLRLDGNQGLLSTLRNAHLLPKGALFSHQRLVPGASSSCLVWDESTPKGHLVICP